MRTPQTTTDYLLGFTYALRINSEHTLVHPIETVYAQGYEDARQLHLFMKTINYENIRNT